MHVIYYKHFYDSSPSVCALSVVVHFIYFVFKLTCFFAVMVSQPTKHMFLEVLYLFYLFSFKNDILTHFSRNLIRIIIEYYFIVK